MCLECADHNIVKAQMIGIWKWKHILNQRCTGTRSSFHNCRSNYCGVLLLRYLRQSNGLGDEGDLFFNIYNNLKQNIKIIFKNWFCIQLKSFPNLSYESIIYECIHFTIVCYFFIFVSVYTIISRNNTFNFKLQYLIT